MFLGSGTKQSASTQDTHQSGSETFPTKLPQCFCFTDLRFTVCDVCEQLKAQLHDQQVPLQVKLGAVTAYRNHLRDQYIDRSTCWQLCDVANAREGDVLVCWLDAMEQAKFAIPRHRGLRTASATSHPQQCFNALFINLTVNVIVNVV